MAFHFTARIKSHTLMACFAVSMVLGAVAGVLAAEPAASDSAQQVRVWRSADGTRSEEAAFDFARDGYVHVVLRDGTTRKVPLSALSDADKQYVASRQSVTGGLFEADDEPNRDAAKRVTANRPVFEHSPPPSGITPDQEAYNNLMIIAYALESRPLMAEDLAAARLLRTDRLSKQMRDKVAEFNGLLTRLQEIDQAIANRKRRAENDASGATFEKGLTGGLEGAGALAQVDVAANGEPAAGALAYMVAGAIGGAIRAQQAAAAIQEEADHECRAMRQKQAEMASAWNRGMEELAAGALGRYFIADRVLTNDAAKTMGKDGKGARAAQRWGDLIRMRVATLSVLACELENNNTIDPQRKLPTPAEWQELIDLAIAEWPTCVEQRCPQYASLHKMRAKALLEQSMHADAEKAITTAINMFAKDDDAYITRARVFYNTRNTSEAIRDVRAAISLSPRNSSYHIFKAFGHAMEKDSANVFVSLKDAYALGWYDIDFVRSHELFQPFKDDQEFKRLTTVKWSWNSTTGLLAGDVYLTNDSPFAITKVKLKVLGSAQQPELEAEYVGPGQKMHWQWVDNTAADAQKATMVCDQHP